MYTKVDSTMTIGDLIAGKDYRVVVYCGYDVEKDIPKATENKIGSVIGWFKVENGKIVSDDKIYDEAEPVEKELVVVVDKKFFDGSELRECLLDLAEERRKKEC
mgnify:CR=1 FL=1